MNREELDQAIRNINKTRIQLMNMDSEHKNNDIHTVQDLLTSAVVLLKKTIKESEEKADYSGIEIFKKLGLM